jgi:hypothetical protein
VAELPPLPANTLSTLDIDIDIDVTGYLKTNRCLQTQLVTKVPEFAYTRCLHMTGNRNIEFVCKPTPRNLGLQNTEREFENSRHLQITGNIDTRHVLSLYQTSVANATYFVAITCKSIQQVIQ